MGLSENSVNLQDMYIIKVKGKAKIPDYIQLRDDNFVLIAYFRADRALKNLDKYGLEGKEEALQAVINSLPFGKLQKLELGEKREEEKRFISMLSDYGFKVTFGNESHPKFIKRSLQALIASDTPIREVKFLRNEVSATTKTARGGLLDMICQDEKGQIFIVEMQLLNLASMIHRVKFYAFHIYNKMVKKGNYQFDDLNKIYTVSILAGRVYPTKHYHQIGTIKNQDNELIDDQITHVIVELDKFKKTLEQIETDLDKLLYAMKLTDTVPQEAELPDFMREDWLEETLAELERSDLTPDQRADWEMMIAGNMSVKAYWKKEMKEEIAKEMKEEIAKEVKIAVEEAAKKAAEETARQVKEEAVINLLKMNILSVEQIAEAQGVSVDFVRSVEEKANNQ